ncbi:MAG: CARDB domain-containing protein [Thermodesulfovibrionales bacterium]
MKKVILMGFLMTILVFTTNMAVAVAQDGDKPDLIVTELIVQKETAPGMKILITDVVRNIGTHEAGASINRYYLKPQDSSCTPILLGRRYVSELDAGDANIGTTYLAIPSKEKLLEKGCPVPGDYYIIAVADAFNYVKEAKESNNKRKSPIHIVDLTP